MSDLIESVFRSDSQIPENDIMKMFGKAPIQPGPMDESRLFKGAAEKQKILESEGRPTSKRAAYFLEADERKALTQVVVDNMDMDSNETKNLDNLSDDQLVSLVGIAGTMRKESKLKTRRSVKEDDETTIDDSFDYDLEAEEERLHADLDMDYEEFESEAHRDKVMANRNPKRSDKHGNKVESRKPKQKVIREEYNDMEIWDIWEEEFVILDDKYEGILSDQDPNEIMGLFERIVSDNGNFDDVDEGDIRITFVKELKTFVKELIENS